MIYTLIYILAALIFIGLIFYSSFRVGIAIGSGMEQARVVDYINQHPSRDMFRMADTLYQGEQPIYNQPWGTNQIENYCTYPTCECPHKTQALDEKV